MTKYRLTRKQDRRNNLTIEYLKSVLRYEPDTGLMFWIVKNNAEKNSRLKERLAGTKGSTGHYQIKINGNIWLMHIIIWFYMTQEWPKNQIDHKDLNPGNNKWENLREATATENVRNRRMHKNNLLGLKGVSYHPEARRYRARIVVNKKQVCLGLHSTPELAHEAYKSAAIRFFGEFARAK